MCDDFNTSIVNEAMNQWINTGRPDRLAWLACPVCGGDLKAGPSDRLDCVTCPAAYPVVRNIPRLLPPAFPADPNARDEHRRTAARTARRFGYQWKRFPAQTPEFEANFLNYVHPLGPADFRGARILDAGCGTGRHALQAARLGAEGVALDASDAIEAAAANLRGSPSIRVVQGDLLKPPVQLGAFDLVYCIGVLHHLSDPEAGFRALLPCVRPGGRVLAWVYSTSRPGLNRTIEAVRSVTARLPMELVEAISFAGACADWTVAGPLRAMGPERTARLPAPARSKLYARYPFMVSWADWVDRLAAPVRHYFAPADLQGWAVRARLDNVQITPTGEYGWRLMGTRR